jgi:transposase
MPPLSQLPAAYQALEQENVVLRTQIEWLKRKLFGGGQGERFDRDQLLLQLGELQKLAEAQAPAQPVSTERQAPRPARLSPAEAFAKLPVQEQVVIEPAEVQAEPEAYEQIGEERTFEVDVVPPRLFKREFVRRKYRRKDDSSRPPVIAPAPARPVAGGYASAGLLAWIAVSKYLDHQPLFRLEQMSQRWGAQLPRQSMVEWMRQVADLTEPIYKRMLSDLLDYGYVQVDETPIRYHDPQRQKGQTEQGYFWGATAPGHDIVFQWCLSRRHAELMQLLGDKYEGLLQADGYEAYDSYASTRPEVVRLGCWAHARRKFHDALGEAPQRAGFMLTLIGHLYRDERTWTQAGLNGPGLRSVLRTSHWSMTLNLLHRTAVRLRELALPKSTLGLACNYLINQWDTLVAHLRHGQTRLDTNLMENAVRPTKLGAKNWLFIGHPDAGQRSAIIYSLIQSCRRHGKDPLAYLRDVLTRLPTMTNQDDLGPLLPRNWTPTPTPAPEATTTATATAAPNIVTAS